MAVADLEPVMVVGVGRSGTSLVQSMLASHPGLAFPPETGFLRRYVSRGTLGDLARRSGEAAVVAALASDERFARTGLDAGLVVANAARAGRLTDAAVYASLLQSHATARGRPRVGDKDPKAIECLDVLAATFPRAYVVHVIRDPRDVLASKKRAAWARNRAWPLHVVANRAQLYLGRMRGPQLFQSRYVEIIYEELIATPERVLAPLCTRLDLEFDPAMLEFGPAARALVAESELAWKRETLGPLIKDNQGQWRESLTDFEVAVTERVCGEAMTTGAYNTSDAGARLGAFGRLALPVAAGGIAALSDIYARSRIRRTAG